MGHTCYPPPHSSLADIFHPASSYRILRKLQSWWLEPGPNGQGGHGGNDFGVTARCGGDPRTFSSGETIFQEGDAADCLYVVHNGESDITLGKRLLKTLRPGEIFGEMALIDGAPRSATAVARTDVTPLPVNEQKFVFLVGQFPYFALNVMRVLGEALRTMNRAL